MVEKIDIHNSEKTYLRCIEKLKEEEDISKINKMLIMDFLKDSAIGKTARKGRKKQVNVRARMKNLFLLKTTAKFIKKDFDKITQRDMEKIINGLNDDTFKSFDGKKYAEQTKSYIKMALIQILRWLYKENSKYRELTDWIDCSFKRKEKPFFREEEIECIIKKTNTLKQRFLFAFLFDSGARIEEFMNIRIGDLTKVESNPSYYKVLIRSEFSKTQGRTIGLFWKYTTNLIDQWLEEHPNKSDLSSPLYPSTYDGIRMMLSKLSKRIIHKHITPHLMRHSSATYYASRLNRQQLCIRYGWKFSSNMPDIYIQRSGVDTEKIAEDFRKERYEDLIKEFENLKQINRSLREADSIMAKKMMQFLDIFKNNRLTSKLFAKEEIEKLKQLFD